MYQYIAELKNPWTLDSRIPSWLVSILGVLVFIKIGIVFNILRLNRSGTPSNLYYARLYLRTYCILTLLSITAFLHIQTFLGIYGMIHLSWWLKPFSFMILLSLPLEILANRVITHDYKFVKTNKLQGRDYTPFTLRVLGLWILATITYACVLTGRNSIGLAVFVNFLHVTWSTLIIILKIRSLHNLFSETQTWVQIVLDTVWLIEASMFFIHASLSWRPVFDLDIVLLPTSLLPMLWLRSVHGRYWARRLLSLIKQWKNSASSLELIDLLHYCFRNKDQNPECQFYLSAALIRHTSTCTASSCLCSEMVQSVDSSVKIRDLKGISEIYNATTASLVHRPHRSLESLTMVPDIGDRNLRSKNTVLSARIVADGQEFEIFEVPASQANKTLKVVNFDDPMSFTLFLSSQLRQMVYPCQAEYLRKKDSASDSSRVIIASASLVFAYLSFLVFESKHYISALFTAYDWMYSKFNKKDKSAISGCILQNYVRLAKQFLKVEQDRWFGQSAFSADLWKVLEYHKGVHKLQQINRSIIAQKIEFYTQLVNKSINYKKLSHLASSVSRDIGRFRKGTNTLDGYYPSSILLNYEKVVFELCSQERSFLTHKTRKAYIEAIKLEREHLLNSGSIASELPNKFSCFDSSHVAVFTRCKGSHFYFKFGTRNSSELFGVGVEEMTGCSLNQFMPEEIGFHHDKFMMNYMCGISESTLKGKIPTVVISKSRL